MSEMILWEDAKTFIERTYPDCISEDENDCFYCCMCGEPIYRCDYPEIKFNGYSIACPICEEEL